MIKILSSILIFLMFVNHSYSASMMGKLYLKNKNPQDPDMYPVFEGDRINKQNKYLIRLNGAVLVVGSNSDIELNDEYGVTVVFIHNGQIRFRINPQDIMLSFRTPQGEVFTPGIVKASNGIIDGQITVKENTVVELHEGNLQALTLNGITQIESGQGVLLAQAQIDEVTDNQPSSDNNAIPNNEIKTQKNLVATRGKEIPDNIREILELIGEKGSAESILSPKGEIDLQDIDTWDGDGEVVDFNLSAVDNTSLPVGTSVKVICVRPELKNQDDKSGENQEVSGETKNESNDENNHGWEALVRPYDRYYPEKFNEKSLVQLDVVANSDLHPEGFVNLKYEEYQGENEEEFSDLSRRSTKNWIALVVDENLRLDEETKENRYILEGDDLKVVCLRSLLLVKPNYLVNQEHMSLIGRTVKAATDLNPKGKVKIDGKIFDGGLVDYNLQVKENVIVPEGTELVIIGVSGYDMTLLLQRPEEVLEETKLIGTKVKSFNKLSPFGDVVSEEKNWASAVVTDNLTPFYGVEIEEGQSLTVVGVSTQLLVIETDLLVPPFWQSSIQFAQSHFTPLATSVGVGVATGITLPLTGIIGGGKGGNNTGDDDDSNPPPGDDDDDDDGDDDDDVVVSPIMP